MTALIRRNQNWLPRVFDDFFDSSFVNRPNNVSSPAINVIEHKDRFVVDVAAPGMAKDEFMIRVDEDNNLAISMEHKREDTFEDPESRYVRREFGYTNFKQTIILPDNVDKDKISAKMADGVLSISIPKMSEEDMKKAQRQIEIS